MFFVYLFIFFFRKIIHLSFLFNFSMYDYIFHPFLQHQFLTLTFFFILHCNPVTIPSISSLGLTVLYLFLCLMFFFIFYLFIIFSLCTLLNFLSHSFVCFHFSDQYFSFPNAFLNPVSSSCFIIFCFSMLVLIFYFFLYNPISFCNSPFVNLS